MPVDGTRAERNGGRAHSKGHRRAPTKRDCGKTMYNNKGLLPTLQGQAGTRKARKAARAAGSFPFEYIVKYKGREFNRRDRSGAIL